MTDDANAAFVREVDEEYRLSQIVGFWKQYGRIAIGVIVVIVLAVGGVMYFRHLTDSASGSQGRKFDDAIRSITEHNEAKAGTDFRTLATTGNPGYSAMARFAEAELLFKNKNVKGAAARYAEIAADTNLPQPYRDRATVQQTLVEFDTMKPEAVIDRLKTLAVPDSPWFGSAGEMVAAAYLKMGRRDAAAKLYGQIGQSSGVIPDSIRQRAVQMAGTLGVDASQRPEDKKTQ